ncbi:reverse transcriptase [Cucumis melo var. makuwa]|uniref:Reverse transcriptase n=1 Tax=Cucumis melo var. makuwa TaxID=1194695 RepID=A0A5A7V1Y9_CUCMM|nr:reverse transcriptase [Cucumis melo var. makuwa]TYJ99766.1 reverse transcriptase [Cucumis melo var. makuwa]
MLRRWCMYVDVLDDVGSNLFATLPLDFGCFLNVDVLTKSTNTALAITLCQRRPDPSYSDVILVHSCPPLKLWTEVVLEAFKQLDEGEINNTPNRHNGKVEKGVGKRDGFTLVTRKKNELVSVRDCGKSMEVIMPNSFGSLLEVGDADKWALSIIEGSPPPLQVDEGTDILSGVSSSISPKGTLTDLLSGVCVEVFCVYASNSNIERRLLWRRLVEITYAWSRPGGEMEDFDLAIRDADLVEPSVQGIWFTWTSKVEGSGMLRRLDRVLVNDDWFSAWPTMLFFNHWVEDPSFIEVVAGMWNRHEGVSDSEPHEKSSSSQAYPAKTVW